MVRSLAVAVVLLSTPSTLLAQVDAAAKTPPKPKAAVLEAFNAFEKAEASLREISGAEMEKVRAASETERDAARKEYAAAIEGPRKRSEEARAAFVEAFALGDWNAFDAKADQKLLTTGLFGVGQKGLDDDPALARQAFQTLLETIPDSPQATSVRTYYLPTAFAASGAIEEGIRYLEGAIGQAPEKEQPSVRIAIGDLLAASGKVDRARAEYEAAAKSIPETLEERDPRERSKGDAELRLALVGLPCPDVDSETWIGGEPNALSDLRGKVVVVDFWATWCGPCRRVMPALNALYKEKKDEGLVVLGLTRFYANGYLPANPEQMQSGGESVKEMDETSFLSHVKAFKENTGIEYPFVVGTAEDFQNYKVRGIPTVAVIDATGKVCFVGVGSGSEPGVRAAVEQALKRAN